MIAVQGPQARAIVASLGARRRRAACRGSASRARRWPASACDRLADRLHGRGRRRDRLRSGGRTEALGGAARSRRRPVRLGGPGRAAHGDGLSALRTRARPRHLAARSRRGLRRGARRDREFIGRDALAKQAEDGPRRASSLASCAPSPPYPSRATRSGPGMVTSGGTSRRTRAAHRSGLRAAGGVLGPATLQTRGKEIPCRAAEGAADRALERRPQEEDEGDERTPATSSPTPRTTSARCSRSSGSLRRRALRRRSRPGSAIPRSICPPRLSEPELVRHVADSPRGTRRRAVRLNFLGGGIYDHYVPAAVRATGQPRRVRDRLHAVPSRSVAGHAPGALRVPDDDRGALRARRLQRIALRWLRERIRELESLCTAVLVAGVDIGLSQHLLNQLWAAVGHGEMPHAYHVDLPPAPSRPIPSEEGRSSQSFAHDTARSGQARNPSAAPRADGNSGHSVDEQSANQRAG